MMVFKFRSNRLPGRQWKFKLLARNPIRCCLVATSIALVIYGIFLHGSWQITELLSSSDDPDKQGLTSSDTFKMTDKKIQHILKNTVASQRGRKRRIQDLQPHSAAHSNPLSLKTKSKSNNSGHGGVVNPHTYSYLLNIPYLCDDSASKTTDYVLFLIHSSASHVQQRQLIRDTWASVRQFNKTKLIHIFLLADPLNEQLQDTINEEFLNYSDIAQENFVEHYRNLTHKHLMGYRWAAEFCSGAKVVIKVDDDVLVNVYRLVYFLRNVYTRLVPNDAIYCSVYGRMPPRRDKSDKWYVSEDEYPRAVYPPYCEGLAYIIDPNLLVKLLEESVYERYYWIDDVYVTGLLMERLHRSRHRQFRDPFGYAIMSSKFVNETRANSVLFLLSKYKIIPRQWVEIWNSTKASVKRDNWQ